MRIAQIAFYKVDRPRQTAKARTSQFDLSFEPRAGEITKHDEGFISVSNPRVLVRRRLERAQRTVDLRGKLDGSPDLSADMLDAFPPSEARERVEKVFMAVNRPRPAGPKVLKDLIAAALAAIAVFDEIK
jgi:hypothetical protein